MKIIDCLDWIHWLFYYQLQCSSVLWLNTFPLVPSLVELKNQDGVFAVAEVRVSIRDFLEIAIWIGYWFLLWYQPWWSQRGTLSVDYFSTWDVFPRWPDCFIRKISIYHVLSQPNDAFFIFYETEFVWSCASFIFGHASTGYGSLCIITVIRRKPQKVGVALLSHSLKGDFIQ